jgi:hypothetical protein
MSCLWEATDADTVAETQQADRGEARCQACVNYGHNETRDKAKCTRKSNLALALKEPNRQFALCSGNMIWGPPHAETPRAVFWWDHGGLRHSMAWVLDEADPSANRLQNCTKLRCPSLGAFGHATQLELLRTSALLATTPLLLLSTSINDPLPD